MSGKSYSTSDLSRKSGDIIAEALRHPVTLTQRNKPRLVIMNVEDYEKMRERSDPRRVLTIGELTDVELDEMQKALDEYMSTPDADE